MDAQVTPRRIALGGNAVEGGTNRFLLARTRAKTSDEHNPTGDAGP